MAVPWTARAAGGTRLARTIGKVLWNTRTNPSNSTPPTSDPPLRGRRSLDCATAGIGLAEGPGMSSRALQQPGPDPEVAPPRPKRRRKGRLRPWQYAALIAALLVGAVAMTGIVGNEPLRRSMEARINRGLHGYTVRIHKLRLQPIGGALTLEGDGGPAERPSGSAPGRDSLVARERRVAAALLSAPGRRPRDREAERVDEPPAARGRGHQRGPRPAARLAAGPGGDLSAQDQPPADRRRVGRLRGRGARPAAARDAPERPRLEHPQHPLARSDVPVADRGRGRRVRLRARVAGGKRGFSGGAALRRPRRFPGEGHSPGRPASAREATGTSRRGTEPCRPPARSNTPRPCGAFIWLPSCSAASRPTTSAGRPGGRPTRCAWPWNSRRATRSRRRRGTSPSIGSSCAGPTWAFATRRARPPIASSSTRRSST